MEDARAATGSGPARVTSTRPVVAPRRIPYATSIGAGPAVRRDGIRNTFGVWEALLSSGAFALMARPELEVAALFLAALIPATALKPGLRLSGLDLLLGALIAGLVISNWAVSSGDVRRALFAACILSIGGLARQRISQVGNRGTVLVPVIVSSSGLSIAVILRAVGGESLPYLEDGALGRISIWDLNSNYHAYFLALGFSCVAISFHSLASRIVIRLALVALAGLILIAVLLLGTRAPLISLGLVAAATMSSIVFPRGFPVLLGYLAPIGWVASAVVSFSGLTDFLYVEGIFSRDTGDLNGRLQLWTMARDLIGGSYGIDSYTSMLGGYGAHNVFLAVAVGGGSLYAMFYMTYLVSGFTAPAARWSLGRRSPSAMFATGALSLALIPIAMTGVLEYALAIWLGHAIASAPIASEIQPQPPAPGRLSPTPLPRHA